MLSLKKFLSNIKSSYFSRRVFNLKKAVQKTDIEEPAPILDTPQVSIPRNFQISDFDRMIIEQYLKENLGSPEPAPLSPAIWHNPYNWQYFVSLVRQQLGVQADQFIKLVEGSTSNLFPNREAEWKSVKQEIQKQKQLSRQMKEQPKTEKVTTESLYNIADEFEKMGKGQTFIQDMITRGNAPAVVAEEVATRTIQYNLGQPSGGNIDQRINFFVRNWQLIPDQIYQKLSEGLTEFGINKKSDFSKFQGRSSLRKSLVAYLKNNVGDELLQTLSDIIDSPEVNMWARRNWKPILMQKLRESPTSLSQKIPGEGREVSKQDLLTDESNQVRLKMRENEIEVSSEEADQMVSLFAQEYLRDILSNVQELKDDVVNDMMQGKNISLKNRQGKNRPDEQIQSDLLKSQEQAERLDIYFGEILNQFNNLLSLGKDVRKMTQKDVRKYKNTIGKLGIPSEMLNKFVSFVASNRRRLLEEEMEGNIGQTVSNKETEFEELNDQQLRNLAREFIEQQGRDLNWIPNWRFLIKDTAIIDKYRIIGKLKKEIKNIQKQKYKDPNLIFEKTNPDFKKYFANKNEAVAFIQRTMNQDEKDIGKWAKAGNPQFKRHQEVSKVKETILKLNQGTFDENLSPIKSPRKILSQFNKLDKKITGDISKYYKTPETQIELIQRTLSQGPEKTKEWITKGYKDFKNIGLVLPRNAFRTDAKNIMGNAYYYKNDFDPLVFQTFFEIVEPHAGIINYEQEGKGRNVGDMTHTELYYYLTGQQLPSIIKDKIESVKKRKQLKEDVRHLVEKVKNIRTDKTKSFKQRQREEAKIQKQKDAIRKKMKFYEKTLQETEINRKNKLLFKKLQQEKEVIEERIKNRQGNIDKKYRKLVERVGLQRAGEPEIRLKQKEMNISDKKQIKEIETQMNRLQLLIQRYEKSRHNIPKLANQQIYKIVCAVFSETKDYIEKLDKMEDKYISMKFASSSLNSIDELKKNRMVQFEKFLFEIVN